jgi:hypothetical protein
VRGYLHELGGDMPAAAVAYAEEPDYNSPPDRDPTYG